MLRTKIGLGLFVLLLLGTVPAAKATEEATVVLEETFEQYEASAEVPIFLKEEPNNWYVQTEGDKPYIYDSFEPQITALDGNRLLMMTVGEIPEDTTKRSHQKVCRDVVTSVDAGLVYADFDIFLPSPNVGNGDVQVNLTDTQGTEMLSFYFAPQADGSVKISVCGSKDDNGVPSRDDFSIVAGAGAQMDEWVHVSTTVDIQKRVFYFTLESDSGYAYQLSEQDAMWCRNAGRVTYDRYVGGINIFHNRASANRTAYLDNIYISEYIDPNVGLVREDKEALDLYSQFGTTFLKDVQLPNTGNVNGSAITWQSNSDAILVDADGYAMVIRGETEQTVQLTATISYGTYAEQKSFTIIVPAMTAPAPRISSPVYTLDNGEEIPIFEPETGFVNTAITIANAGGGGADKVVLVVVATERATGKIVAVNTDTQDIVSVTDTVTVKTGIPFDKAIQNYQYYIWDETGRSMKNSPPAAPQIQVVPKVTCVEFSWPPAQDDYGAVEYYEIRRDGRLLTTTAALSYVDTQLLDDAEHTYQVTAVDHDGAGSVPAETQAALLPMYRAVLDGQTQEELDANSYGVSMLLNTNIGGDSYSESAVVDGVPCRKLVDRPGTWRSSLYFRVDETLVTPEDKDIVMDITYFDEGTGVLSLVYNAIPNEGMDDTDNIGKKVDVVTLTDTGTWKTAQVVIHDAKFRKAAALTNSDFRLSATQEMYIAQVALIQQENYA